MISTLGRGMVLLALAAAAAGTVAGFSAGARRSEDGAAVSRYLAYLFAFATFMATAMLEVGLLTHDFSVAYVAEVGSLDTPLHIAIASLWSSLNGSVLFWCFVLGGLVAALAWSIRGQPAVLQGYTIGTFMVSGIFFTLIVAGLSDPFFPVFPVPDDGPGPNALLQNHLLMVVHPPALYIGYVGMAVPASMSAAALMAGELSASWLGTLRRFALVTWSFLTIGIVLGGWWSYEVLGWGGYWSWDPVENASFLPWLTTTAFLHSAMVTERRKRLHGWTLSLGLGSYLLTLLGTFMTRSGVFNSVHSFTQSPVGPFFLVFIGIVLLLSVFLLSARLDKMQTSGSADGVLSREGSFLFQNLTFTVFAFMVLLGTVYPLLHELFTSEKLSVGAPYFNRIGLPLFAGILLLMGLGPAFPWGRLGTREVVRGLAMPVSIGLAISLVVVAAGVRSPWAALTYGLAGFVTVVSLREMVRPLWKREGRFRIFLRMRRKYAAHLVHIGVAMSAVAIAASQTAQIQDDLTFVPGKKIAFAGYELKFSSPTREDEGFRVLERAPLTVTRNGREVGTLLPALADYRNARQPVGSPGVISRIYHDLYVSILDMNVRTGVVQIRARVEPLVSWLWVGGIVMTLGGLVAAWPSRKRRTGRKGA